MSYAQIRDQWFQATSPDVRFCTRDSHESPRTPLAEVYRLGNDGQHNTIAILPLRNLSVAEQVEKITALVQGNGFEKVPAPAFA